MTRYKSKLATAGILAMWSNLSYLLLLATARCSPTCAAPTSSLSIAEVYNPGLGSIFDVSSEILETDDYLVLFDTQFQKNDSEVLVQKIKDLNKPLKTVYVTYSDPDYYFGAAVIQDAFPDAQIVATRPVVDAIKGNEELKQKTWDKQLGDNAPDRIVIPDPIDVGSCHVVLDIEGHKVYSYGVLDNRTFNWIPSLGTVLGGILVDVNAHVWLADTQTTESREIWIQSLDQIKSLNPAKVIPGHFYKNSNGTDPFSIASIDFTAEYIRKFNEENSRTGNSTQLIDAMTAIYPDLAGTSNLETSAQVIKGEIPWP